MRAKGAAWLAVAVLACGFCYSLGFQTGVIRASQAAESRLERINDSLEQLRAGSEPAGDQTADAG
jgi:hypothetical protein